jgi:mRNA-degrading endonuclease RelE of RelBE toxin-antitoxin system
VKFDVENPYGGDAKPLTAPQGRWSARVGGLWIVYRVDRERRLILVAAIGPRGQVYRNL